MSNLAISTWSTIDGDSPGKVLLCRNGTIEVTFGGSFGNNLTIELSRRAARSTAADLAEALRRFDAGEFPTDDED
ncbi:hypothetical protein [Actinokineospora sp.]|uniref:hypothetical protein n=1 Tax=Actinokineospora sp. TaxID=1872133 RepID=UPI00403839CC